MLYSFARSVLFSLDPEVAHDLTLTQLQRAYALACATDTLTMQLSAQCFLARVDSRRGRAAEALDRLQTVARRARAAAAETDLLDAVRQVYASTLSEYVLKSIKPDGTIGFAGWAYDNGAPYIPPLPLSGGGSLTKTGSIMGAAVTAGVEVLVTGDKELLDLGRIANLEVLSPRQFWERLKAQQQRGAGRTEPRRSR